MIFGKYDLVHAHYGLSGLIACLQFFKPVVVTFHGCDVNDTKTRWISQLAYRLSKHAVFVEKEMAVKLKATNKMSVVPCGVNIEIFSPCEKQSARETLGYSKDQKLALFSSGFEVPVKNYPLAEAAIKQLNGLKLIELKNYSRSEVSLLLNACDLLLLTSIREGSPQIVKEAMACNCPVVTTPVGDTKDLLVGVTNSFICEPDAASIARAVENIVQKEQRTNGRSKLIKDGLDLESVAKKIHQIYKNVLK